MLDNVCDMLYVQIDRPTISQAVEVVSTSFRHLLCSFVSLPMFFAQLRQYAEAARAADAWQHRVSPRPSEQWLSRRPHTLGPQRQSKAACTASAASPRP